MTGKPAVLRRVSDAELERSVQIGLGIRPEAWWAFDSDRPDLAEGAGLDRYSYPRGASFEAFERTQERFRHLVDSGLLAESEKRAIVEGNGEAHAWRRSIIAAHSLRPKR